MNFWSVFCCVFVVVCGVCSAADEPVYSSYKCTTVEGADPSDLTARTCVLHNVCVDRVEEGLAVWSYFVDPKKPNDTPLFGGNIESGEIASMSYRNGLNMRIDLVHDRKFAPKNFVDPTRVTVAFCAPTNNYAHFLLDGMFGTHWLLTEHGYADKTTGALKRSNIEILNVCRQSKKEKILRGLFTDTAPSIAKDGVGYCYSTVVVGPASHYTLHGFKTKDKIYSTVEDFDRFRNFVTDRYGQKDKKPTKIVLSFRTKEAKILNLLPLAEALKEKYEDVEVVELAKTPFDETARLLSEAKVLISVTSGELSGMVMMPKDSTVISIVPYATKDTVWGPLAKHFGVNYLSWKNEVRENAVFHPEILSSFGVVGDDAEAIMKADGYNPDKHHWAGEFYCDTKVDIKALTALVEKVIKPTKTGKVEL